MELLGNCQLSLLVIAQVEEDKSLKVLLPWSMLELREAQPSPQQQCAAEVDG